MIDEKNRLNELLRAENSLAQKYAVILCSAVSGDIRTKLTFNQRGMNQAASFIIDEMNSRGVERAEKRVATEKLKFPSFPPIYFTEGKEGSNEKARKGWDYLCLP